MNLSQTNIKDNNNNQAMIIMLCSNSTLQEVEVLLLLLLHTTAIHEVLLHLASTLSTNNLLRYATSATRKDQAIAVMWWFVFVEIIIHCLHHTIFLNSSLPLIKILQASESTVTLGSGHLGGASAEDRPPSVAAVKA